LQFMTPNYLTPDTVDELNELFAEESTLQLVNFFNKRFAAALRQWFDQGDIKPHRYQISRPPHKHRYHYLRPVTPPLESDTASPYDRILDELLPSLAFRKWLSLATGLTLKRCAVLARRFRRGLDYQLAQSYDGEDPRLEYTLNVTPTSGWGADEVDDAADGEPDGEAETRGKGKEADTESNENEDNVGGYELYMAGDEAEDNDEDGSDDGVTIPPNAHHQSHTGAGDRRSAKKQRGSKADPAVYRAAAEEDDDDGILFSNPASWNSLSVVLRDRGTLRFVKYVSQKAQGDRWDFAGTFEVEDDDDEDVEAEAEA